MFHMDEPFVSGVVITSEARNLLLLAPGTTVGRRSGMAQSWSARLFRIPLSGQKWQKRLGKKLFLRPILWCNAIAFI
jgi:hypothetical protein